MPDRDRTEEAPTLTEDWFREEGIPADPNDLLASEEHAALNKHLANLGWQRQRVEAESREIGMP